MGLWLTAPRPSLAALLSALSTPTTTTVALSLFTRSKTNEGQKDDPLLTICSFFACSGLWTAIYLSGQIWRYQTNTSDVAVHDEAWSHYLAMQFQSEATNITGYPGRSVALSTDPQSDPAAWHPAPRFPGWSFKGDTSSDEITGHQQVYPLVYSLLADQTNATELSMVLSLLTNITDNIIEHGQRTDLTLVVSTRLSLWHVLMFIFPLCPRCLLQAGISSENTATTLVGACGLPS